MLLVSTPTMARIIFYNKVDRKTNNYKKQNRIQNLQKKAIYFKLPFYQNKLTNSVLYNEFKP